MTQARQWITVMIGPHCVHLEGYGGCDLLSTEGYPRKYKGDCFNIFSVFWIVAIFAQGQLSRICHGTTSLAVKQKPHE